MARVRLAARGRPWPTTPEHHEPCTIETLKDPFKLIIHEFSGEVLKTDRASKRSVWPYSPIDVSCIETELCLPYRLVANDGQRNIGGRASTVLSYCRRTIPLAVMDTGRIGSAEVWQGQEISDRNDQEQAPY
jgi:hypothetical protein